MSPARSPSELPQGKFYEQGFTTANFELVNLFSEKHPEHAQTDVNARTTVVAALTLHVAAKPGSFEIVHARLERGTTVRAVDDEGKTTRRRTKLTRL